MKLHWQILHFLESGSLFDDVRPSTEVWHVRLSQIDLSSALHEALSDMPG